MIHIHKELLIEHGGITQWEHLDTVYLKMYDPDMVEKFLSKCNVGCGSDPSHVTLKDMQFTLPDNTYVLCDIPQAKEAWDSMMTVPFNSVFGCWPWDYADSLSDPQIKKSLLENGIKNFRMVVLI